MCKTYGRATYTGRGKLSEDYESDNGHPLLYGRKYKGAFYDFGKFFLFRTKYICGISGKEVWEVEESSQIN